MRILITGATGLLGNNIVRLLADEDHDLVAATRLSSDPRPLDGLAVEKLNLDLSDDNAVNLAVSGADAVIHSAAAIHIGWKNLTDSRAVNVEATRRLAIAARRKKTRMIYVSTVDTLGAATRETVANEYSTLPAKPNCSYVVTKREAEQAVLEQCTLGLDAVIVNPGFMVGPWDWKPSSGKMMLMLWKQPILFFTPGGGCSVVDVRDVAGGVAAALEHGRSGQRYILGGRNMTYLELWTLMAQTMNKRPPTRPMRDRLARIVGKTGDFFTRITGRESEINSAALELGQMFHWYSSHKAETELGYHIGSVENALHDAWAWFKRFRYV